MEPQIGPPDHNMAETSEKAFDTRISVISPISASSGKAEAFGSSTSRPGIVDNIRSQSAANIQQNSAAPQLGFECHASTANNKHQKSLEPGSSAPELKNYSITDSGMISTPCRHTKVGECFIERDPIPSDKTSASAAPSLQFFVMSDEGINLFVDLNSTPSTWINNFKNEVCIHPSTHHCEPGDFSNFISSLVNKDDRVKISPSGNIIVDIQSKGAESSTPCANSSLSSTVGGNCQSEAYPLDATVVTSKSCASALFGHPVDATRSHEAVPVVSSSCLTSDVQNNKTSAMAPCASTEKGYPQDSVDISFMAERSSTPVPPDASPQLIGDTDTVSPGKTKFSDENECCIMNVPIAGSDNVAAFILGSTVRSYSKGNSCPTSKGKQENIYASNTVKLNNYSGVHEDYSGVHEVPLESQPVEAAATTEEAGSGDRLSIACRLVGQTVRDFQVTDAQSDASSADHPVAGNTNVRNSMSSLIASGNITLLKQKRSPESAHCHGSVDKKRLRDPEDPKELQSKRQLACDETKSSIVMSLRSAKASTKEAQHNPTALPRRSMRLVPK